MEGNRLEDFKKLLLDRREALLRDVQASVDEEHEHFPDEVDIASMASAREATLRLQDRERKLIDKIDLALLRIRSGAYGLCEACGGDIDERRLLARPVATQCIDCQTEAESLEGRRRAF